MAFALRVWRLLLAVKDALVLALLLLFFAGLYAALTARGMTPPMRDGALLIRLEGAVVEEPHASDPLAALSGAGPIKEVRSRDLLRALDLASTDSHVKAVALDLSRFTGAGLVNLTEIGAALDRLRLAHKPVLVYGFALEDAGMLLAAHADEVWIDPLGGVAVPGPGGYHLYYGRLLERLKITAHVFRVGTYKDFVEPFIRNDQSEPSKAARKALYDAIWAQWRADVAKARPKADIARVTADPVGWLKASGGDTAGAALAAGLVDRIGTKVEFGERMAKLAGRDTGDKRPGGYIHNSMASLLAAHPAATGGKAIGVITVAGEIVDGKAGPGTAGGDRIAKAIDASAAKDLAALVVRVDSPGGSVTAAETIRAAIVRARQRGLPVVVSMANVAASGGYWVSTPAQRIFAEPGTITGSIGIFAVIPSFEKALASWGVTGDGVRTTALSGQPDVLTGLTPETEAMVQASIENGYARFIGLVAQSRGKTPAQVDTVAQGRVWDGGTAHQLGLVDQFGGLDEAVLWAAKAAKLQPGQWHVDYLGEGAKSLLGRLREQVNPNDDDSAGTDDVYTSDDDAGGRDWIARAVARRQETAVAALAQFARLMGAQGVQGAQAYCLDCLGLSASLIGPVAPPASGLALAGAKGLAASSVAPVGLWARLARALSTL